ncbi:MAG: hypothetical protein AB7E60_12400 [Sphingobium sp.]
MNRSAKPIAHAQTGRSLMGYANPDIRRTGGGYIGVDPGIAPGLRGARGLLQPVGRAIEMPSAVAGDIDDDARPRRRLPADAHWWFALDPERGHSVEKFVRLAGLLRRRPGLLCDSRIGREDRAKQDEQAGENKDAGARKG